MMRSISLFLAITLMAQPLLAATTIELNYLPVGKAITEDGIEYRGYTLEEWPKLLELDQNWGLVDSLEKKVKNYIGQVKDLEAMNQLLKVQASSDETEIARLELKWTNTDRDLQKAKHASSKALLGSISLVLGGGLAVLGGLAFLLSNLKS